MTKAELGLKWYECDVIRENTKSKVVRFKELKDKQGNCLVKKRKPWQIMEIEESGRRDANNNSSSDTSG